MKTVVGVLLVAFLLGLVLYSTEEYRHNCEASGGHVVYHSKHRSCEMP